MNHIIQFSFPIFVLIILNACILNSLTNPNILVIFIDDLYYTQDLSINSAPMGISLNNYVVDYLDIPTPNIQSFLSDQSIIFPRSYAGGPKCSPSRYTLLTGRYPPRCEYSINQTISSELKDPIDGTYIEVPYTAITAEDAVYNMPNILKNYHPNYQSGMVGKYHLMPDNHLDCASLDSKSDKNIYESCISQMKTYGFDFVDAWYHGNIDENADFSHNPEWIVHQAQKFINQTINSEKNFFLYFSTTLAHAPSPMDALKNSKRRSTPKGMLKGDDIPSDTGMKTREEILQYIRDLNFENDDLDIVAGTVWVDDIIGALMNYLKQLDIYDDTLIAILNDHGMIGKSTLYEHGCRVMQYIRYPQIFNVETNNSFVLPDNFIVSTADLCATIYDIIGIDIETITNNEYIMDGTSWTNDVINQINEIPTNECCKDRHSDIFNSHSIINERYQYIYRATDKVAIKSKYYINAKDLEQLYDLEMDPDQQVNQINNSALLDIICEFKFKMVDYIENIACPTDYVCSMPDTEVCFYDSMSTTSLPLESTTQTPTSSLVTRLCTDEFQDFNGGLYQFNGGCNEDLFALIYYDHTGSATYSDCVAKCSEYSCKSFVFGRKGGLTENWCNIYSVECTDDGNENWYMFTSINNADTMCNSVQY